jgi:hypothetical protein
VTSRTFSPLRLFGALLACLVLAIACFVAAVALGEQPLSLEKVMTVGSPEETIFF